MQQQSTSCSPLAAYTTYLLLWDDLKHTQCNRTRRSSSEEREALWERDTERKQKKKKLEKQGTLLGVNFRNVVVCDAKTGRVVHFMWASEMSERWSFCLFIRGSQCREWHQKDAKFKTLSLIYLYRDRDPHICMYVDSFQSTTHAFSTKQEILNKTLVLKSAKLVTHHYIRVQSKDQM